MGEMILRPVSEGELVNYGDVFAWVSKTTPKHVHSFTMFVRHKLPTEKDSDCWVGVDLAWSHAVLPPELRVALVPLVGDRPRDKYHWERVL